MPIARTRLEGLSQILWTARRAEKKADTLAIARLSARLARAVIVSSFSMSAKR
jgi:hypothetical protein